MSLPALPPLARVREPRSRARRRFVPRCQVPDCRARACTAVSIELPAAWEASPTYTVLTVQVGACREHARELRRRSAVLIDARGDLHSLLAIVEAAADAELARQRRAPTG